MKVFISWSGPKSRAVAKLLKHWVKYVLQTSSPWVSTHDIEQGRVAMTQLFETLNEAKIGIICLTPKNHEKPWILFEAGAISSKFDESRVLTLLLDGLEVSNLKPPLGLFQATYPDEEGMKSLLWRINALLASPLEREIFDQVFQTYWPQFETEYKTILRDIVEEGPVIEREEGEKLDEILKSVRSFDKRVRSLENISYNKHKNSINRDESIDDSLFPANVQNSKEINPRAVSRVVSRIINNNIFLNQDLNNKDLINLILSEAKLYGVPEEIIGSFVNSVYSNIHQNFPEFVVS